MNKFIEMLKAKSIWYYIGLGAIPFALGVLIRGHIAPGFALETYSPVITVMLVLGIATQIAGFFFDYKFVSIVPVVFYAAALGLVAYYAAPVVMDMINKLNFQAGNWVTVKIQIAFMIVNCIFAVVPCFADASKKKAAEEEVAV